MTDYNEQQLAAIRHTDGPAMVIAGPGCGKTAVITGRIAELVKNGVQPTSILVVTFTRAAAAEMKGRYCEPDGGAHAGSGAVAFGTFHSIFFHILKTEYHLDPGCIIGEDFKINLLKEIIKNNNSDPFWEYELAAGVAKEISSVKGNGISSENFYSNALPCDVFRKVFGEYRRWLAENRKLDFEDIITAAYQLFRTDKRVLDKWRGRFGYILVDEFQDINPLQYLVIKMLALPKDNLFVVGDDDQSIYRFRGAEPSIMLKFPEEHENCAVFRLTRNYRSTPQIISAAGKVIGANKKRFHKNLDTANKDGPAVNIQVFENVWEENDSLSLKIREAAGKGIPYDKIAVLVRTNRGAGPVIEKFIADRIPFCARQEVPCVFDHFIAKDLLAYLDIAAGSTKKEDYIRIINKPNRYITRNAFYESRANFETLYKYYEDRTWMWQRIEDLERDIHAIKDMPPYGAVSYIRKITGYDEYIRGYAFENKIPPEELLAAADEIMQSARSFSTAGEWKAHIEEYTKSVKTPKSRQDEKNSVIISTLHGSKGKEYDIVYIVDANEGIMPYHKASLPADIEEERRLFYVGMTRARHELNIFAAKNRFEKQTEISPFLKDMMKG
jgi:DNA helicase-2/ATP-dependent DNA helicase PcrA